MKTVKVSTDNVVSLVNIDFDDYQSIQKAIGGHFETVRTRTTASYFGSPDIVMLVDEEGLLKGLPENMFGCVMYGTAKHGHPIVGDLILARVVGEDITAPDDAEALKNKLLRDFPLLMEGEEHGRN